MYKLKAHILFFSVLIATFNFPAYANNNTQISSAEDVAIAFYKTGKAIPNFDSWIKQKEVYLQTPWGIQDKIYDKELQSLKRQYQEFTPDEDLLVVYTKTNLKYTIEKDKEGNNQYFLKSSFKNAPDAFYFPYKLLNQRIVLMPYALEDFLQHQITKGDYDYVKSNRLNDTSVTTIIRMYAHEADMTQPYKIDGLNQWVLKTKIATIEFWSDNRLIYEYSRPDYLSPHTINLQQLYKDKPTGTPAQKGTVKPVPEFIEKN